MGEIIEMKKVPLQRGDKRLGAGLETDSIVDARIVNDAVNSAEAVDSCLHGGLAGLCVGQLSLNHETSG